MQARMSNPATILPGALQGIQALFKVAQQGSVPLTVLELVHLRESDQWL